MLKMSSYADRLLEGLDETEFMEKIKTAQINWIGKSEGAYVDFKIKDEEDFTIDIKEKSVSDWDKEKNLNTAANALSGASTIASLTATVFNATVHIK